MRAYRGRRVIAPFNLNFCARRRWMVSFIPRPLYPQEKHFGAHWIWGCVGSRAILDVSDNRNIFASAGIRTPDCLAHGVVATPTTLFSNKLLGERINTGHFSCRTFQKLIQNWYRTDLLQLQAAVTISDLASCLYECQYHCLAAKFAGVTSSFLTIGSPFYLSCLAVVYLKSISQLHKLQCYIIEGECNKWGMTLSDSIFVTTGYP